MLSLRDTQLPNLTAELNQFTNNLFSATQNANLATTNSGLGVPSPGRWLFRSGASGRCSSSDCFLLNQCPYARRFEAYRNLASAAVVADLLYQLAQEVPLLIKVHGLPHVLEGLHRAA